MAIPWPSSLQQLVNQQSFVAKWGETVIRSDMDIGPAKVRRRFTRPIDTYTVNINLTITDYNNLYNFYNSTLNGGVNTFEFNHPITGVLTTFRFLAPPQVSPMGGTTFQATMEWEALP